MLGNLFKFYREKVSVLACLLPGGMAIPPSLNDADYNPADADASRFGNAYRGHGILVALLGVLTAWSQLYPENGPRLLIAHVASVVLLVAIAATVWRGNRSNLKERWIDMRGRAEGARYQELDSLINALEGDETQLERETLIRLDEQIAYNLRSHAQFFNLGLLAKMLGMMVFALLLANATITAVTDFSQAGLPKWLHDLLDSYWLFKALPALAVGLASANGFLRTGQLADDHRHLAQALSKLRQELLAPDRKLAIGDLARAVRDTLAGRDSEWVRNANTYNLSAG